MIRDIVDSTPHTSFKWTQEQLREYAVAQRKKLIEQIEDGAYIKEGTTSTTLLMNPLGLSCEESKKLPKDITFSLRIITG